MIIRATWVTGLIVLLVASGCVQTTVESYRKVPDSRADSAFIQPGVDFSRYRKLQPVPLEIYYYEGEVEPHPEDLARVRQIFRKAFLSAIGDDYELVEEPGPDVLGVRASLVDLELSPAIGTLPVSGRAAALVANGQLTFFMELTDSETGKVLARAGDSEEATSEIAVTNQPRDWSKTEVAAEKWAQMFRDFHDENLGGR